jgi:hypothetical protein
LLQLIQRLDIIILCKIGLRLNSTFYETHQRRNYVKKLGLNFSHHGLYGYRSKSMIKTVQVIVAVVLLQVAFISTAAAAPLGGGEPGKGMPPGNGGECGSYHTVQYGETLYSIGRSYGVNPQQIAQANGLMSPDYIYAGQSLYIPCSQGQRPPPQHGGGQYPGYGQYPTVGYGYDFTGYYYETYYPGYRRYSYTCGYHYNCY